MSYLQLNLPEGYAHEQSHICKQLSVGHVMALAPIIKRENFHRLINFFISCLRFKDLRYDIAIRTKSMQSTILKNFLVKIIYRGFPVSTNEFIKIQVGASCIHA